MIILSALLLIWLQLVGAQPLSKPITGNESFIIFKSMPDGELQRLIRFNGTCAREIILDWGKTYLTLRELWYHDTKRKYSFFHQERNLADCTEEAINYDDIYEKDVCGDELRWSLGYDRTLNQQRQRAKVKVNIYDVDNETTIGDEYPWMLNDETDVRIECEIGRNHKMRKNINDDVRKITVPDQRAKKREKRGFREFVIAPGTKWCGPDRLAFGYKDLGALDGPDRCCRRHDHCPQAIGAFSSKYGLFNYMPFTLSHCSCDDRFRACLKLSGTSSANVIGKIFFNMVQTKCFVLKPSKVCVRRSWWGKCEKHKYKKQAYMRDNISY